MALSEQMNLLRIDYDKSLVPAGGAEVVGECASPLPGEGRMTAEPAGRKFHEKAMRVRGLITGTCRSPRPRSRRDRQAANRRFAAATPKTCYLSAPSLFRPDRSTDQTSTRR
jgi:DnaJ family protein C protein 2